MLGREANWANYFGSRTHLVIRFAVTEARAPAGAVVPALICSD